MKKLILILGIFFFASTFAKSYKAITNGEIYVKTEDGEMIQLDATDVVNDEDTIIVGDKSSITIIVDGNKIVIRSSGAYKVSTLIK